MAVDDNLSPSQRRVKQRFIEAYGSWNEGLDVLVRIDEGFIDAIQGYLAHPWQNGPLAPKDKALIHVALNAAPTTLYAPGTREHVGRAFDHGATVEELTEVVEIVFIVGIHSITTGVPILADVAGLPGSVTDEERAEHERIKQEWIERRGFWSEERYERMVMDVNHFEEYLDASAYPWERGVLDDRLKELIYVAIDGSPTHLFEPGLQLHIENALEHGATREEILETLQIAGSMGLHAINEAMPIIAEEARERGKL